MGTHKGFSFFVVCGAIERLDIETTSYAVDTWRRDDHAGFYGEEVFADVSRVWDELYCDRAVLLRGLFDDRVVDFADGSIDLPHIDGRHGYDDVTHDFDSWLPKLSERGIVTLHNVAVRDRDFGVWRFWDELASRFPSFNFMHGNGLGVVAVGSSIPDGVRPLLHASAPRSRISVRSTRNAAPSSRSREARRAGSRASVATSA